MLNLLKRWSLAMNRKVSGKRDWIKWIRVTLVVVSLGFAINPPRLSYMVWLSCVKHAGDDDLDVAILQDKNNFLQVDAKHRDRGATYLSDWHNGPRHYDWWEQGQSINATGTVWRFVYRYWNPLFGTGERVFVVVDPQQTRPWPAANQSTTHPPLDYRILSMSSQGDHSEVHQW